MDYIYSLVSRRIWTDARFRALSRPQPNARDLFLYLLTTPHATNIPGLLAVSEETIAADLKWLLAGTKKALAELEAAGMAKLDREAGLLWVPNAIRHNPPRSPDNVKSWRKVWQLLPECALLTEAAEAMMHHFAARGGAFPAAFSSVSGLPMPEPMVRPMVGTMVDPMVGPEEGGEADPHPAHQEQDQDQEQENPDPNPPNPPPVAGGTRRRRSRAAGDTEPKELEAHVRYAKAFAEGITRVTGQPFTTPLRGGSKTALWQMASTFAKDGDGAPLTGDALLEWFRDTAAEYRKARSQARRDLEGGFSPVLCQTWLDAGKPAWPPPAESRPGVTPIGANVESFRAYWLAQFKASPFGYGDYTEAQNEVSLEAYSQLLGLAGQQQELNGISAKQWAKHWVDHYLRDADQWITTRRHAFAVLVSTMRREPGRWGKPGSSPHAPAAANTGAKGPNPRFAAPMQRGGAHVEAEARAAAENFVVDETKGI